MAAFCQVTETSDLAFKAVARVHIPLGATKPDVPTKVLLVAMTAYPPADYLRRIAGERLGIKPDEIDGGHCIALSRPVRLADRLVAYLPRV